MRKYTGNINVISALLSNEGCVKATKYLNPKEIIRAVRTTYGGKIHKGNVEITLTIGRPNYLERMFLKECIKAKKTFPIEEIQLKFVNPKRGKLKRK